MSSGGGRRAVFLDRDGTVLQEERYLADPDGVVLVPRAVQALKTLRDAGYALVIVTNQSGIARGLYTENDYRAVAERLDELLAAAGVPLDATRYCAHHPDCGDPCRCRKPDTGMYRDAANALGLDLKASYYVGDKITDVRPALVLGGKGVLVRTGFGAEQEPGVPEGVAVADDLWAAARLIVGEAGGSHFQYGDEPERGKD